MKAAKQHKNNSRASGGNVKESFLRSMNLSNILVLFDSGCLRRTDAC